MNPLSLSLFRAPHAPRPLFDVPNFRASSNFSGLRAVLLAAWLLITLACTASAALAATTISGFAPVSGPVGTLVTITGTDLTGATAVTFNSTAAANYTVNSATQITATVAANTTTGQISVTVPGAIATSANSFTVTETPSLVVTTNSDTSTNTDGLTSLREAIAYANSLPSNDTITFSTSASGSKQTIVLSSGLTLLNNGNITITGPAAGVAVDGVNKSFNLFTNQTDATFSNLTFDNGNNGLLNQSSSLTVINSTFRRNNTGLTNNSSVNVTNCTFSGNTNGFVNNSAPATLASSTISGNNVGLNNTDNIGVSNSLIVGNTTNVIGSISGNNNITSGTAAAAGLDPNGLQDNDGPTLTIALTTRGTAVNKGNNNASGVLTTDQRGPGFPRIVGGVVDIGAFESNFSFNNAPAVAPSLAPANPKTDQTIVATPNGTDADNDPLTYVYTFSVNNVQKQSGPSASFDLSVAGNGDKGDIVRVSVVANDGKENSLPSTAQVTVANTAPVLNNQTFNATIQGNFSVALNATDADGDTLTYSVTAGTSLPAGLSLNTATGVISGTPAATGVFRFSINVSDGTATTTAKYALVVSNRADGVGPLITYDALPASGTRADYASRSLSGTVQDVASGTTPPSGVSRVLVQLRTGDNTQAYNGSAFSPNLGVGYYVATLGAGGVSDVRSYDSSLSFFPGNIAPGDYLLLLYPQDNAGNYTAQFIKFTIVQSQTAPPSVSARKSVEFS